jgi:hypothetical protein
VRVSHGWTVEAPIEVRPNVIWTVSDEGTQLYIGAALFQEAIASHTGDASLSEGGVLALGKKGF